MVFYLLVRELVSEIRDRKQIRDQVRSKLAVLYIIYNVVFSLDLYMDSTIVR